MTHRFPIKEIALQTGLGTATIDRVLNDRPNVSPQTRQRVKAAIKELEGQVVQLAARGRRMFFDFVVEAPSRFSKEVKRAAEAVLPEISGAVCRPRFLLQEIMSEDEVVSALSRIAKRGSQGVCLKARDLPKIRAAVDQLVDAGIPVITLVTDIPNTKRLTYVGVDNAQAGRTAAYLISRILGDRTGSILTTTSHNEFLGEGVRAIAFKKYIAKASPNLRIVETSGGSGVPYGTSKVIDTVIHDLADIQAVYSMGGGNRAILDALGKNCLKPNVYIAHDADAENIGHLKNGSFDFVLNHDLKKDMRNTFNTFLYFHELSAKNGDGQMSVIEILTPEYFAD